MLKIETKEKECQGVCPICGSDDIECVEYDQESYSDSETNFFECLQCKATFYERYTIIREYGFTGYEVEIPLNDRTLFD